MDMKITAQEEYGLRCLLQLASHNGGGIVTVKDIACKEGLSNAYTEKLLRILQKAGIVQSIRGIKGGYILVRKPDDILLGEVMRALGGILTMAGVCRRYTGQLSSCIHIKNCGIRPVWSWMIKYIQDTLDKVSLSQLIADEKDVKRMW